MSGGGSLALPSIFIHICLNCQIYLSETNSICLCEQWLVVAASPSPPYCVQQVGGGDGGASPSLFILCNKWWGDERGREGGENMCNKWRRSSLPSPNLFGHPSALIVWRWEGRAAYFQCFCKVEINGQERFSKTNFPVYRIIGGGQMNGYGSLPSPRFLDTPPTP